MWKKGELRQICTAELFFYPTVKGVRSLSGEEEKRRVVVKIMGEEYVLRSSQSREHMLEVGERVNRMMAELSEKYPRMSMQKIAVLTSLNLASDLLSFIEENREPAEPKLENDKEEQKAELRRNKKNKKKR